MGDKKIIQHEPNKLPVAIESDQTLTDVMHHLTKINNIPMRHNIHLTGGHAGSIFAVCPVPGERKFLTASGDNTIRLWDEETKQSLRVFHGHRETVRCLVWRPGTRQFISTGWDNECRLWDLDSGDCIQVYQGHSGRVRQAVITPDGKQMLSVSVDKTVKLWEIESGYCLLTGDDHHDQVRSIIITNDGSRIYTGAQNGTLFEWDRDLKLVRKFESQKADVFVMLMTQDQTKLYSGNGDGQVIEFDRQSGQILQIWQVGQDDIYRLLLSGDEKKLLVANNFGNMHWLNLGTGQIDFAYSGPTFSVQSIVWPDSQTIYFSSSSQSVRLHLENGNATQHYRYSKDHNHPQECIALSPDKKLVAIGDRNNRVCLFEEDTGKLLRSFKTLDPGQINKYGIEQVRFSSDGKLLIAALDKKWIYIFDTIKRKQLLKLEAHEDAIRDVWIWRDKKQFISVGRGLIDNIKVWNTDGTFLQNLEGHTDSVFSLAIRSDWQVMATGSGDQTIRLWDSTNFSCYQVLTIKQEWIMKLAFSPNGKRLAAYTENGHVFLYEVDSLDKHAMYRQIQKLDYCSSNSCSLTFSPTNNQLAIGTKRDGVRIWDIEKETYTQNILGHWHRFYDVVDNSDKSRLLATAHNQILSWSFEEALHPRVIGPQVQPVTSIMIEPDNKDLYIANAKLSIKKVNLESGLLNLQISQGLSEMVEMVFRKQQQQLISGNSAGFITGHDITTGLANMWLMDDRAVECMVYAPVTQRLFAGYNHWGVSEWDLLKDHQVYSDIRLDSTVTALFVNRSESWLYAAGKSGMILLYDMAMKKVFVKWHQSHSKISAIVLSDNEKVLITGTKQGYITIADPIEEEAYRTFQLEAGITKIKTIVDSDLLLVGLENGLVQEITDKGKVLKQFVGHQKGLAITGMELSEDQQLLTTSSRDGTVRFWDRSSEILLGTYYNVRDGYLWTTPSDVKAPQGWFWTDKPEVIHMIECDENGNHPKPAENEEDSRQYFNLFHNKEMVMKRIFHYEAYKKEMERQQNCKTFSQTSAKQLMP